MHLFVPFTVTLPKGIGKMEALEELSVLNAIKTSPEALEELEKLEKLKVLNIMWNPERIGCSSLRGGGGELGTNKNYDLWLQLVCTKLKLKHAI